MTISIRVATSPGETQIAVVKNNRLLDFALWRPGAPDGVGDLHRGRVIANVPAMAGAFVALTDAEGFLPDSEGAKGLTAGTILLVRITRAAQGSKGPRLTARPNPNSLTSNPPANGPVTRLSRGPDPIVRLAARYPNASITVDDAALAATLRQYARASNHLQNPREAPQDGNRTIATQNTPVFSEDIAEAIDALSRPIIDLPNGARISIWPTPALVAIDVDAAGALTSADAAGALTSANAAGALAAASSARPRHEALNQAAVPAIADQIRLRNLSGAIVVDLAGLSPRKRTALAPDFTNALSHDPLHPKFLGFTALGLAEIVRSRVHPPLHELLAGPLAAGLAALRAVIATCTQDLRDVPAIRAHPAVVSALQNNATALPDLVRRVGRPVTLRSDPSLPPTIWMLEKDHG